MIRFCFLLALLLAIVSCNHNEETVSFDELAPNAERDYNRPSEDAGIDSAIYRRPEASEFLRIVDTISKEARWQQWDTTLFADRFGPLKTEKWIVLTPSDSLSLVHYQFRDSLKTKNAFFNYLDCFGAKCRHFTVGDNVKVPRRNALILVGAKSFVIVEGNARIDETAIRSTYIKKPEEESWIYLVNIPKAGKTTWKRIDKGVETPVKKAYENS
jgi:hypothetical protein